MSIHSSESISSATEVAHILLAHTDPSHLEKIITKLQHANSKIFIHIDAKVPLEPFNFLAAKFPNCELLTHRYRIHWGGFSMVHATLRIMEYILKHHRVQYINLLSGSDYPLRSAHLFHEFLADNPNKGFVEYEDEASDWGKESIVKTSYYHYVDFTVPGKYWIQWVVNSLLPRRTFPKELTFIGRSQWMTLTTEQVAYVLKFEKENPKIIRYFRYTWGADEYFFQSILYASPHQKELVNNNLRFIRWEKGKASPEILTEKHYKDLIESHAFFGRKFDPLKSESLINLLDADLTK